MASTYQESVEQTITAGEQIHQIVNGTATTEVTVEDGSKVPSIRKALLDNFYFKDPITWQVGQTENVFNQLRQFTDGSWWYAPSATASNPISMGATPVGDSLWKIYDFDAIGKLTPQLREALRRSYAEAGYNVVGTFEDGFTYVNANDIGIHEATGKGYTGPVGDVSAGTDPTIGGFVDRSYVRSSVYVGDFVNFSANHTAALQSAIEQAKLLNAGRIILPNQTLNLICNESGSFSFAAAVVFDGLHNCEIIGAGPNSELKAAVGGTGAPAFAIGRIQNCTNLSFHGFKVDGDYVNHSGDAGSRSAGFILTTFNRESQMVDLGPVKNIRFIGIECNDVGAFIWVARRSEGLAYANPIYGLFVDDCYGHDAAQANNCIGLSFVTGGAIRRNRFTNTATSNPYPSLYVDVSRGCRDVEVEHNYGRMFVLGMKSEGHAAGSVYAVSDNVNFRHNICEEIGDPNAFTVGSGSAAGSTYAYKIRSENSDFEYNTCTARTELVTTGGLYSGILIDQNTQVAGINNVHNNSGAGSQFGIVQVKSVSNRLTSCKIHDNKISAVQKGIIMQADCDVDDNELYETSSYAVDMQIADNSRVRRNRAFNCASSGGTVFNQGDGGSGTTAGYFEFLDNEIQDTRGASAASTGYRIPVGTNYANSYRINKGVAIGLTGNVYLAEYIGLFGDNDIKFAGQINGTTLAVALGYNISSVTSVDATTIQINFKRALPASLFQAPAILPAVGGIFTIPYGSTVNYYRIRFVNSSGTPVPASTVNVRCV